MCLSSAFSALAKSASANSISTIRRFSSWVYQTRYIAVGKCPQHKNNGIDLTNVRQKGVAETFAVAGAFN